jgi:hypothetical protein
MYERRGGHDRPSPGLARLARGTDGRRADRHRTRTTTSRSSATRYAGDAEGTSNGAGDRRDKRPLSQPQRAHVGRPGHPLARAPRRLRASLYGWRGARAERRSGTSRASRSPKPTQNSRKPTVWRLTLAARNRSICRSFLTACITMGLQGEGLRIADRANRSDNRARYRKLSSRAATTSHACPDPHPAWLGRRDTDPRSAIARNARPRSRAQEQARVTSFAGLSRCHRSRRAPTAP